MMEHSAVIEIPLPVRSDVVESDIVEGETTTPPLALEETDPRNAGLRAVDMVAQILRRPRRRFVRLFVEAPMCWQREYRDLNSALVRLSPNGR